MNSLLACYKVFADKTYDYLFQQPKLISPIERIYKPNSYYEYIGNIINQYSFFFSSPTHIIDNIYLGSAFNAASYYTLKELNIKKVVNVTQEISQYYADDFEYKTYKLYDNNLDDITNFLEDAYNYITMTDDNILVHCYMGSSRSATIVVYYLMKKYNMSLEESIEYVKTRRNIVNLTTKFKEELNIVGNQK